MVQRRYELRRDTEADWLAAEAAGFANLAAGEPGIIVNDVTGAVDGVKFGDGVSSWSALGASTLITAAALALETDSLVAEDAALALALEAEEAARIMADAAEAAARQDADAALDAARQSADADHAAASTGVHAVGVSTVESASGAQAKADAAEVAANLYADAAVAALVSSSPAALDTLNELAAALGDDPNFATTVNAAIAARLTEAQGDARYRLLSALLATADLGPGIVTAEKVAAALKDPVATTAGLRTLGGGAQQAAAGSHAHQFVERTVGFFHGPLGVVGGGARVTTAGWTWCVPIVLVAGTYDKLQCEVVDPGGSTTLYLYSGRSGGPDARLAAVVVDTSTSGYKVGDVGPLILGQGVYWMCLVADNSAVTFRVFNENDRGTSTTRQRSLFSTSPIADPAGGVATAASTAWMAIRRSA